MRNIIRALVLILGLSSGLAAAQTFPSVPDHSFIGRIGTGAGSGPSQAIPWSTVVALLQIYTGITGDCTATNLGVITCTKTNGAPFGTMATQNANSVAVTGGSITGLSSPTNPSDAATKAYVDASVSSGITPLPQFATLATAAILPNSPTYANGTLGVGATLTAGSNSTLTVDGTVATLSTIVLVNNQAASAQNGIYSVTTAGSGSAAWVLTRVTFFNQASNMLKGSYIFVTGGATQYNSAWTLNATTTTVGTTAVNFNPFSQIISISAAGVTYVASGGSSRTQATRNAEWPSVTDYGAKCDGSTDDTTAIQAAINATPAGGTLKFPTGLCLIATSGVDNTLLLRTTPISMIGTGEFVSGLEAGSGIGTTKNLLTIRPAANTTTQGYSFRDMTFSTQGTGSCVPLMFDAATNGATVNLSQIVIERVAVQSFSSCATPFALYFNNVSLNANGAFFDVTVRQSRIYGGIYLGSVGDTIRIQNNLMTGPNAAVIGQQISGAGQLLIDGNNITNTGGAVVLDCAYAPRISHNEFEQSLASTESHGAIIDLNGGVCTIGSPAITENQLQAVGGIGTPLLLRMSSNVTTPKVDSNILATPTSYSPISNASASLLCGNNVFSTGTPHVSGTAAATTWGNGC